MKTVLSGSFAATALVLALSTTAFAQGKGVSESKGGAYKGQDEVRTVPEPGTLALLGLGVGALAFIARRGKKK